MPFEELRRTLEGELRDDPVTRRIYSVDASIYEVEPVCVVTPKSKEDILRVIAFSKEAGIPLIARGAGTGITGGCLGPGIILDFSKHLNRILEVDYSCGRVVCEPGVVQDHLNALLGKQGYRLGPDTSTGNRATIGGMLANNAAGARSLKYGRMVDAVLETELALASGRLLRFRELSSEEFAAACSSEEDGEMYRVLKRIQSDYREEIHSRFPHIPRRVSGYNLDELARSPSINLSKLIAGSEGTLGITTEITLKIVPQPQCVGLCIVHFTDMAAGMEAVPEMLALRPISLEVIDCHIIQMGKQSPEIHQKLEWLVGDPEAVFAIEIEEDSFSALKLRLEAVAAQLKRHGIGYAQTVLTDREAMSHIWQVRKAGLGLLMSKRSYSRAIAFIEDVSVAPEQLAPFLKEFKAYLKRKGKDAGIYGHAGSGCMHIRPFMDMRKEADNVLMKEMMRDVTAMLKKYGGALSGEHGDGLIRSWLNQELFGEKIYEAFCLLKQAFDPENRMNPGKIVFPEPFEKNRRLDPTFKMNELPTFLDFSKEGGFALSADMCNGNGQCRKKEGTMCPSFQATDEEFHSTRARAQVLRAITNGRMPLQEFSGEGLHEVLDLCLQCKGCKTECPSQVDMAKMKAEFLYHYHKQHGIALRDRLFGFIGKWQQTAFPFSGLVGGFAKTEYAKGVLDWLGIASSRELPELASFRFSRWAKRHPSPKTRKPAILFSDTFTEFNEPEVGIAAKAVLEALGYEVHVPAWSCCGRTLISKGFLPQAKRYAERLIQTLLPWANEGVPMIGLEPSCLWTIKDDYQGLLGYRHPALSRVMAHCTPFDSFLARHIIAEALPIELHPLNKELRLHGHCHQKALAGTNHSLDVLRCIPEAEVSEIPSGCCGMAGAFGYEKEHYELSVKIAGLQLMPALSLLDPKDACVVADGFSCRHQVRHLSSHRPRHLAEVLYKSLMEK